MQLRQSCGCELSPSKLGQSTGCSQTLWVLLGINRGTVGRTCPSESGASLAFGARAIVKSRKSRILSPVAVEQPDVDVCASCSF